MAEKIIRVDDLDGSEGDDVARREFEILERRFGIDLSLKNHVRLEELLNELEPFLINATEVVKLAPKRPRAGAPTTSAKLAGGHTNTDLRKWANANGFNIGERGRFEEKLYEAYYAAHPDANPNPDKVSEQISLDNESE